MSVLLLMIRIVVIGVVLMGALTFVLNLYASWDESYRWEPEKRKHW